MPSHRLDERPTLSCVCATTSYSQGWRNLICKPCVQVRMLPRRHSKIAGMSDPIKDLGDLWEWFAEAQCRGYSPLYERISVAVARDRELLELVRAAPTAAHMPPTLLGAVHYLLLAGFEHPLADFYGGGAARAPPPLFLALCA